MGLDLSMAFSLCHMRLEQGHLPTCPPILERILRAFPSQVGEFWLIPWMQRISVRSQPEVWFHCALGSPSGSGTERECKAVVSGWRMGPWVHREG